MTTVNPILTDRLFLDSGAEAAWCDGGSSHALIPMKDGDYTVGLDKPSRDQQHVVGDANATYNVTTRRDLKGGLKVGLFPHIWETLFAYAMDRDSNNEVGSRTFRRTFPGLQTVEHLGVKVNSLTVEGSKDNDVDMTLDLVGCWEQPRGGGVLSYPGSYVIPNYPSLVFANTRVIACLASSLAAAGTRIAPANVESYSITLQNNLKMGPPVEDRFTKNKDKRISYLQTGRQNLSAKMVASFDRTEYLTLDQDDLYFWFKIIGAHPSYSTYAEVTADAAAGSAVSVAVDDSSIFAVGDPVYFDAFGGTTLPCVGVISAIADSTHITITTLDEAVKDGDHVFAAGFELKTAVMRSPSMPKSTPYGDFVTVELNGDAFSGGANLLSRKTKNLTVPS